VRPWLLLAPLTVLLLCGCSGLTPGGSSESATNEGVYPPSALVLGRTYSQWGDEWWKWALAIPKSRNPMVDETGASGAEGQSGPVWFLCGTVGTSAERSCTVPSGKTILFPPVCGFWFVPTDAATPGELPALARFTLDHVTEVAAVLDGRALRGLAYYRFHSDDTFVFTGPDEPDECIYVHQNGSHEAYADGFWVMLEPLTPGSHELSFRGKVVFPETYPGTQVFETSMTYHLTVE
jgi:hypothetical protein